MDVNMTLQQMLILLFVQCISYWCMLQWYARERY